MVDLLSTRRNGFPSNFKRPRLSANRQYPRCCGTLVPQPDLTEAATCPQIRKYPTVKARKRVLVRRDFPAKKNASQTCSRLQIPSTSVGSSSSFELPMVDSKNSPMIDSKDGFSTFWIPVADSKKPDASLDNCSAVEIAKVDCKQLDAAVEIDCKLSDASSASGASIHECMCIRQDNISFAGCPSKLGASISEGGEDNQELRVSTKFAASLAPCSEDTHASIFGGEDKQEIGVSMEEAPTFSPFSGKREDLDKVKIDSVFACEPKQENVSLIKNCNHTGGITDVKESSLPMVASECNDVEEPSPSMVVRDEQYLKGFLNDKERENLLSITFTDEESERVHEDYVRGLFEIHKTLNTIDSKSRVITEREQDLDCKDMAMTENEQWTIASNKVKEVINLFQELYLELSQQSGRKNKGSIHLEVASILRKQQKRINMERRLGPILGIEVGDCFDWRAELNIIGLHRQGICGIDYMESNGRIVATSIVDSGLYGNFMTSNDDQEFPYVLAYSGVGQNPKLEKGNLALKNSSEVKTPIRVIRKVSIRDASSRKIVAQKFVYDGLYFVDSRQEEISSSGKLVFKFVLKRFPNQRKVNFAKLVWKEHVCVNDISEGKERIPLPVVNALDNEKPPFFNYEHVCVNDISEGKERIRIPIPVVNALDNEKPPFLNYEHVCVNDISEGKERIPIPVVNALDNEKPPFFNYVTNVIYPKSYYSSDFCGGCDCSDGCVDFGDCPCVKKNGGQIPYNDEGCIVKAKRLVVECGPFCNCFSSCNNTVSQNGIRFPLEVFKTESKGWGVRSQSFIPCGSFICEYTGEILGERDAEQKIDNDEYLFDIGNNRSIQDGDSARPRSSKVSECFTVDAARYGNVARFINHSCSPNLFAQNVLFDHDNHSMPHIMLFAMENIPPKNELTYDYNYRVGEVCDRYGNIKMKACHCGSNECSGRMY